MLKKVFIYGLGTFFSKVIVFLLVPIYTRALDPAEYGTYDVVYSTMQMIVSICFFELWTGTLRFLFDYSEKRQKDKVIKTTLTLCLPLTLLFVGGAWAAQYWITISSLPTVILFGISYALFNVVNNICRGTGKNLLYVLSGIISSMGSCGLGVFLIVGLKRGANALLWASSVGYLAAVLFVECKEHIVYRALRQKMDWKLGRDIMAFSLPLLVNSVAFSFLTTYDKGLIANVLGTTESGYYATVSKFTTALSILGSIFQLAWQEQAFSISTNGERNKSYETCIAEHIRFMGLAMPICALALQMLFPILVGKEYQAAATLIPVAIWGTYLSAFSGIVGSLFSAEKKTGVVLVSTIVGAVFNVLIVTTMLQSVGTEAVNIALAIGFGSMCMIRMITIRRYVTVHYDVRAICLLLFCFIECTIAMRLDNQVILLAHLLLYLAIWIAVNHNLLKQLLGRVLGKIVKG